MTTPVAVIWWVVLIAAILVVLPITVTLLTRALRAARHIDQYTAEMLAGGVSIADNTRNLTALQGTISTATQLLAGAESIERSAGAIESTLATPTSGDGSAGGGVAS